MSQAGAGMGGEVPARVLVVANSEDHIARGLAQAFLRRGCQARVFDLSAANHWVDRYLFHTINHWAHNFRLLPKGRNLFEQHPLTHRVHRSARLLELCRAWGPELVFHVRSWPILPPALAAIREAAPVLGWWIEGDHRFDEVFPSVTEYDKFYFFSTGCVETAARRGLAGVGYLPHAIDTAVFTPLAGVAREYDWVFVGKWTEYRQRVLEPLGRAAQTFALYGPGWETHLEGGCALRRGLKGKKIWGAELVRLYNQSKVVLNITQWAENGPRQSGMNLRVLEALACGACLLTDHTGDSADHFDDGRHLAIYHGAQDAVRRYHGLMDDQGLRDAMGAAGLERVARHYSFDNRVEALLADWRALASDRRQGRPGRG